jgi:kynurenine formamidase
MFDLSNYNMVDLSPRMVARIKRLDGTIEEGNADIFGLPWSLVEGNVGTDYDNTKYTLVGGWNDDDVWPWGLSGHFGSHTEGGKGHIDHWSGIPDDMLGLWEYPLETFIGEAVVCDVSSVTPVEGENEKGEKAMIGQPITPDHLDNVKSGDIVLMYGPDANDFRDEGQPILPAETAQWLAQKKIKMLAIQMPGVAWETNPQAPEPNNSPTHRAMLCNNIPITYPLVNVSNLKQERVMYIGMPLSVERLDGCWIRAIALEDK